MVSPVMYLTVELKHREFDSRLLIALHAVKAGFTVVVGQQWAIFGNASALPAGVVLYKTVNDIQARSMPILRKFGHLIAATDEETLLCTEPPCFVGATSKIAVDNWDMFYAQSEIHKDAIIQKFPGHENKITVTGNSRVDMMHDKGLALFRAEAAALKATHGPYVLFNSNFAGINSIWGSVENVAQINRQAGGDDATLNKALGWEKKNRDELIALIEWTANNLSSHRVVIRPHPGENVAFWIDRFGLHERIKIVPRSNHIPWILGADVVAHSNCTTGLEAAIADVPVLNLVSVRDPLWCSRMTDFVNPCVSSWQDAAVALKQFLSDRSGVLAQRSGIDQQLETYFSGYRSGNAAATIASSLGQLLINHGGSPDASYRWQIVPGQQYRAYQRGPALKEKMTVSVSEALNGVKRLLPIVGLTRKINIAEIEDSLFLIQPV